jgi:hypothetical protein
VYIIEVQGQCSGGIWPIQDTNIGSFTISWRYNIVSNTIQFIIQGKIYFMIELFIEYILGQANSSINLTSTYIAIGWSDTASTMVCILFKFNRCNFISY